MSDFDEKVYTPVLIGLIHLVDILVRKIGRAGAMRAMCRMGEHNWISVPNDPNLRYCYRCGITDDIRTSGIDGMSERKKRRLARKLYSRIRRRESKGGRDAGRN